MSSVAELDLDLDVFQGPFDLLLAVLLREEVSLAEVGLAEIIVAYLDHLERAGRLDLEAVTEFLVLITALMELKSRMLLPSEESDEPELGPEEAADELLARMLEYRRYKDAAAVLSSLWIRGTSFLYREAAPPPEIRRAAVEAATKSYEPDRLGLALEALLTPPPKIDSSHIRPTVSVERRVRVLRDLLSVKSTFDFGETFGKEDRITQAVTIFALLDLYRRGEARWKQDESFGPITVTARAA